MSSKVRALAGILALAAILIGGCSGKPGTSTPPEGNATQPQEVEILVNGNSTTIVGIDLPINRTEAETIVRESCGAGNQSGGYEYALMEEVDGEWRIPISNSTPPCYATVNETTGETNCSYTEPEPEGVIITTNKTEYEQEEVVNITVKNNLRKIISCERCDGLMVWSCYFSDLHTRIQKFEKGEWEGVKLYERICNDDNCGPPVCNKTTGEIIPPPCSTWGELGVGEVIGFEWDQKVWNYGKNYIPSGKSEIAEPGIYRLSLAYSLTAGEIEYAYSNNFTIWEKGVTITTDKTMYKQGEVVNITITIKNNLENRWVWYEGSDRAPVIWSCSMYTGLSRMQECEKGEWKDVQLYDPACGAEDYVLPSYGWGKLEAGEEMTIQWNLEKWDSSHKLELAEPGKYRLYFIYDSGEAGDHNHTFVPRWQAYSNNFTIIML